MMFLTPVTLVTNTCFWLTNNVTYTAETRNLTVKPKKNKRKDYKRLQKFTKDYKGFKVDKQATKCQQTSKYNQ